MDLFSSLKTAYDSIGSEISKSFDSTDFEKQSTPAPNTQPRAEPQEISGHKVALIQLHHDCTHTRTHTHTQAQSSEGETVGHNEGNDFNTSWSQWEDTPTRKTPQQEKSSPPLVKTPPTNEATPKSSPPLVKTPPTNEATPNKPMATSTPAKETPSKGKSSVSVIPPSLNTLTTYTNYTPSLHTLTTHTNYTPSLNTLTTHPHYTPSLHTLTTPSLHTLTTPSLHTLTTHPH